MKSLKVNTRFGSKDWHYQYDGNDRLSTLTFPDTSTVKSINGTREDGQPWIAITGRDASSTRPPINENGGRMQLADK